MRRFVFDTDTASDDTIALLTALKLGKVEIVTVVAGNIDFHQQVQNALYSLEYFGHSEVPVYLGPERPIMGRFRHAKEVHGEWGMGRLGKVSSHLSPKGGFAPDKIVEVASVYPGKLEILAVSPLTNLALAYLRDRSLPRKIRKVWVMGGALYRGNTSRTGEFNFWVDPEAAQIVFDAGFDITVVPWETAEEYGYIDDLTWETIERAKSREAKFFVDVNSNMREYSKRVQGNRGSVHPDTLTVVTAFHPEIIKESVRKNVSIETCSESRGAMMVDFYGLSGYPPNAEIITKVDRERFLHILSSILLV